MKCVPSPLTFLYGRLFKCSDIISKMIQREGSWLYKISSYHLLENLTNFQTENITNCCACTTLFDNGLKPFRGDQILTYAHALE